jgi:23S rRNA (cytosine1962-C5)-methyltransferase
MLSSLLAQALSSRASLFDPKHESALRLFNGFLEGDPNLVIDLYGRTAVLHNYADNPSDALIHDAKDFLLSQLDWLKAIIVKTRNGKTQNEKCGEIIYGNETDRSIREFYRHRVSGEASRGEAEQVRHSVSDDSVRYAIDLTMNQDASFYLDTRNVRQWAMENLKDKTVLNTFAYTGSLGVAAMAGGASRVVHLDLNRKFLNLAKESYTLNGFPIRREDFIAGDFYPQVSRLKREEARFDCVFVDPPFFSITRRGKVDLNNESHRLINKVRPLINDGGYLLAINNALFVSGAEYMKMIEELCADGYLSIEQLIPVPQDCVGYNVVRSLPVDPAPFNHSTKIVVLRVKRK